jgi:hypothetical protein
MEFLAAGGCNVIGLTLHLCPQWPAIPGAALPRIFRRGKALRIERLVQRASGRPTGVRKEKAGLSGLCRNWTFCHNDVMLAPLCQGADMRRLWCWLCHRRWWVASVVGYFDAECWCNRCEEYRFGPRVRL